jgi:hypothetical protein
LVGHGLELFENCPFAERTSQQSRLHTNAIANRHIWRLGSKENQGLSLCGLDKVVTSPTREITTHFDFDLVSLTLARWPDRSNSAFNHRLIWLRQHVQK